VVDNQHNTDLSGGAPHYHRTAIADHQRCDHPRGRRHRPGRSGLGRATTDINDGGIELAVTEANLPGVRDNDGDGQPGLDGPYSQAPATNTLTFIQGPRCAAIDLQINTTSGGHRAEAVNLRSCDTSTSRTGYLAEPATWLNYAPLTAPAAGTETGTEAEPPQHGPR
jgi:hypothetical protein